MIVLTSNACGHNYKTNEPVLIDHATDNSGLRMCGTLGNNFSSDKKSLRKATDNHCIFITKFSSTRMFPLIDQTIITFITN